MTHRTACELSATDLDCWNWKLSKLASATAKLSTTAVGLWTNASSDHERIELASPTAIHPPTLKKLARIAQTDDIRRPEASLRGLLPLLGRDNPRFSTAVRQAGCCAFQSLRPRQPKDLVQCHVRRHANAADRGPARRIVNDYPPSARFAGQTDALPFPVPCSRKMNRS